MRMTDLTNDPFLLTPSQLAEHVQVSTKTVLRAIARGELRAVQIGQRRAWRICPDDVDAWLETRANRSRSESALKVRPVSVRDALPRRARRLGRPGRLELADL
jgi:excisionase family DNA binding protein